MGLLSNRIERGSLKPGDHIYSWRTAYIYAHHGIYIGDDKVIHFTRRDRAVVLSCLNCFLAGGILYRCEYAVNAAYFLAKARGGTCTLAVSDPVGAVVHRAKYLLENGFGCYDVFKNNCEDFAIYCKTGLLVLDQGTMGQSGQAASLIGVPLSAVLSTPLRLVTTNVYVMVATAIGVYCASRYATDIGIRRDAVKMSVEHLTMRPATGLLSVVEPQIPARPVHAI